MTKGRKKTGWAEPNLFRAQQAVSRLVERNDKEKDAEEEIPNNEVARYTNQAKSRKMARKEARKMKKGLVRKNIHVVHEKKQKEKEERIKEQKKNNKKKKRKKKRQAAAAKAKLLAEEGLDEDEEAALLEESDDENPSKKAHKTQASEDNPMLQRLRAAGLIAGGSDIEDEDDKLIRDMEKKLGGSKKQPLFTKDDPLGDLFSFADDIVHGEVGDEEGKEKDMEEEEEEVELGDELDAFENGYGFDDDEDEDEDEDDMLGDDEEEGDNSEEGYDIANDPDFGGNNGTNGDNEEESDDQDKEEEEEGEEEEDREWKIQKQLFGLSDEDRYKQNKEETPALGASKYIPPALRKKMAAATTAEGEISQQLMRAVRGTLNKLNTRNMNAIVGNLEEIFRANSRNNTTTAITKFILDACIHQDRTLKHLLQVYASCIACLHSIIGFEVSASFLQSTVEKMHGLYQETQKKLEAISSDDEDIAEVEALLDKRVLNMASLVSLLYCFNVVDASFIYDILNLLLEKLSPQDIELIMEILKTCGSKLRSERDKKILEVLSVLKDKATQLTNQTPRVKFMIESVLDLHSGRWRILKDNSGDIKPLAMVIRSCLKTRKVTQSNPLRVSLDDILNARTRGRWWLVGAAWAGRSGKSPGTVISKSSEKGSALLEAVSNDSFEDDERKKLQQVQSLASQQRMNTDIRRKIFSIIMTSDDYIDAVDKLVKLNLKGQQEREVIRVAVDCCVQEVPFNRYYAVLIHSLCTNSHSHKHTLKYVIWDRLREMESYSSDTRSSFIKFLSYCLAQGTEPLVLLKIVEFNALSPVSVAAMQTLFVDLLTNYPQDKLQTAFENLQRNEGAASAKAGIHYFVTHFMDDAVADAPQAKRKLLKSRINLVIRACTHAIM